MPEQTEVDPDFEFFDSTGLDTTNSPTQTHTLDDLVLDDTSQQISNLLSPKHHHLTQQDQNSESGLQSTLSTSSESPTGSYRDSSSETSDYPRKSSSGSITSAQTPRDVMMEDDSDLAKEWNILDRDDTTNFSGFVDGCINPSVMNAMFYNHENVMNQEFDFESSSSSPTQKKGAVETNSLEISNTKSNTSNEDSEMKTNFKMEIETSQQQAAPKLKRPANMGSREASPPPIMVSSQGSSPTFFPSPSPGTTSLCSMEYVNGSNFGAPHISKWTTSMESLQHHGLPVPQRPQHINPRIAPSRPYSMATYPLPTLFTIHPTPLKSRVETQIPIKMTLYPVPIGITKLHLPTHTISKPKLLAKPTPEKSPDTLELYTSLVCTSAMRNPQFKLRALERAAASARSQVLPKELEMNGADEDDESKPANGGEVKICGGCIIRERKRAARKKAKKAEEEESWQKYETQRVIVFNTHEVKDWQTPSQQLPSEATGDLPEPYVPEGAMQVDAPMRIACYCRHQNEKSGFQVIFTLKDHQDKLVAQAITSSIMITDDHKTCTQPPQTSQPSSSNEYIGQGYVEGNFDMNFGAPGNPSVFRTSHSSTDLQTLQHRVINNEIAVPSLNNCNSSTSASSTLNAHTSRQTSPSTSQGPAQKKRKASGSNKVPSALTMTRLGSAEQQPVTSAASTVPSPFTPSFPNFPSTAEQHFNSQNSLQNIPTHFKGPPTPNSTGQMFSHVNRSQSMENIAMQQIYSTPGSGISSRVSSPNGMNMDSYQRHQAQLAQVVGNELYGIPMSLNPHRPPTIHKMIPNEGPKSGGLEVTCLGSGFVQGLEVMFGDTKATTTTFWGETSLVCLLPPSSFAGNVPVTFKHQHQPQHIQSYPISMSKQHTHFKYVDDDELQILRTALSVLGHKMTGKIEDVRDLARRIVVDQGSNWASQARMLTNMFVK
ncbi:hypothetical protein K3495_g115 [Podosphaera aphanis]|nr:hypothetical protein K3495_g115 [Podosphaera aphanis]